MSTVRRSVLLSALVSICALHTAPLFAKTIGWAWDDPAVGAAGWTTTAPYTYFNNAAWVGGWTTTARPYYNLYSYNEASGGFLSHVYPKDACGYFNPCNQNIQSGNGKSFTFSSAPIAGATGVKYVTFDVSALADSKLTGVSIAGKSVNPLFMKTESIAPGWTRVTAPVGQIIPPGTSLSIAVGFDTRQSNVSVDNVSASVIFNPINAKVTLSGVTYTVPAGYSNFTGALDANGSSISVSAEVAGKLLAVSQALGELQKFNPSLKETAIKLIDAGKTNSDLTLARDQLINAATTITSIALGNAFNPSTYANNILSGVQNVDEAAARSKVLALATTNAYVVSQSSDRVVKFNGQLSSALVNGTPLNIEDIQVARESLRIAEGAAHSIQKLVSLATQDATLYGAFNSLANQVFQEAMGAVKVKEAKYAGDVLQTIIQSTQMDASVSASQKLVDTAKALATYMDSEVYSPLDSRLASEYQNLAVQNGFTNPSLYNPLAKTVLPNQQDAILMGQATAIPNERLFEIAVAPLVSFLIDPIVATGFEYRIDEGPSFASVTLPTGFGDDVYRLWRFDAVSQSFVDGAIDLIGGQEYLFGGLGVSRFQIRGIETSAGLDPLNHGAFVAAVKFSDYGDVVMRVNPLTETTVAAIPEPETYAMLLAGLGLLGVMTRRRKQKLNA